MRNYAHRGDGVVDVAGQTAKGVGVPRWVSRGGYVGRRIGGGVSDGVPKEGFVVRDGVEHFGDTSAIGVMLKETLEASVARGGEGSCGAARGGGGGNEAGLVGKDRGGLAEQLSDAA